MPRKHFLDIYTHSNRSGAGTIASSPITTRECRKGLCGAPAESRAVRPDASWLNGNGFSRCTRLIPRFCPRLSGPISAPGAAPHKRKRPRTADSQRDRCSPSWHPAQGNQVQIVIRALLTVRLLVVNLQVLSGPADLTLPAISLHDPLTKLFV
jgi:hypothetical protein